MLYVRRASLWGSPWPVDGSAASLLWVTQAVLPTLREHGSGHIVQISSVAGIVAFPNLGVHNASEWALEGLNQTLAQDASFGVKVTLIEPGGFVTGSAGSSGVFADPQPADARGRGRRLEHRRIR